MHVTKLRMTRGDEGLVPAGEYFKRLAQALREANARKADAEGRDRRRAAFMRCGHEERPSAP